MNDEQRTMFMAALARDRLRQEAESLQWEHDVGLTNAPPRRRTEPAITVTLQDALAEFQNKHGYNPFKQAPPVTAFTRSEVEAIVTWGSDAYCSQAMVCDEARERAENEAWKRYYAQNGDYFGWRTDLDGFVYSAEEQRRRLDADDARTKRLLAALPRPLPNEHPSDYACRTGMHNAARMGISYDEWAERVRLEMAAVERGEPCA